MTSAPDTRPDTARGSTGAAVSVQDVTVTYHLADGDALDAVVNAELNIEAGSVVALLGPSGCGKTSLLRAIAGLERPTSGSVTIGDRVVSTASTRGNGAWVHPERRNVGMVFQDGALFPHLTVSQNVAFGLRTDRLRFSRSERSARVAEMLSLVDLADFGDRLPGTLSGGQQQRVALARSLAPQPSILLLDEPFSALDAALRIQVRAEVLRIIREVGVTTIFVTHDQDEAFVLGDRVAVLRDGHIEQVGSPDELYRHPTTPWVAGFVGEANFVEGTVDTSASEAVAQTSFGVVPIHDAEPIKEASDTEFIVPVQVLIRPEQIAMAASEQDTDTTGGCRGTIRSVEYYGHDVRYEVMQDNNTQLAVRTQSPELFEVNQRVKVIFSGQPTKAWPADTVS